MAIPIEGYSVVAKKERIEPLLSSGRLVPPHSRFIADDELWACAFMAETDADRLLQMLAELELNVSQGPDSDAVVVNEFDRSVAPYCEWLITAPWEKALIAWKAGTAPRSVSAWEGWDPKIGSKLKFKDTPNMEDLEFVRHDESVDVYRDRAGQEWYVARAFESLEDLFQKAGAIITRKMLTSDVPPLVGEEAEDITRAIAMLEKVVQQVPAHWNSHWLLGKGHIAIGQYELACQSFRRAFELEKDYEPVPRELAGVCLTLGYFDEAIRVSQHAVTLSPDNAGSIANLALAQLFAGRLEEAQRSIAAAMKLDPADNINLRLQSLISAVAAGDRPQPKSMAELLGRTQSSE